MKAGIEMKKVALLIALASSTVAATAADPVAVERFKIELSIACRDGRVVEAHHASLLVPLDADGHAVERPVSQVDPFSLHWVMRNACEPDAAKQLSLDVRNVSESGFVVAGETLSLPDQGPGFASKSQGGEVAIPLVPQDGVLRVRVTAASKQMTPDLASALQLIKTTPAEID
ncbi:MAG: hypothetical protein EPN45_19380 [Rhizobiaceae bacterium]|nr:MAG: hypothetical protein EPN45_19380 [Rhizobiaceae bacterium]